MANDVERLVIEDSSGLPEELSGFSELIVTDTERLYGIDDKGKREQLSHLAHVVINLAAKATGDEVERLAPASESRLHQDRGRQPADIEKIVQRMVEERIDVVTRTHEQQTEKLQSEIDRLRTEIERLQKPLQERLDDDFGDRWVPREKDTPVLRAQKDGYMDEDWALASEPYEKEGKWYARIKKGDNEVEEELINLKRPRSEAPAETAVTPATEDGQPTRLGWWRRARLAANNAAMYPLTRQVRTVTEYDEAGRPTLVEERRSGAGAFAVGAVAVGTTALVTWLLTRHGGHDVVNNYYSSKPSSGGSVIVPLPGANAPAGHHLDLYNQAAIQPKTGVYDPNHIQLVGNPGHESLIDTRNNATIVKRVGWDSQGALDYNTKHMLKRYGLKLTQGWFGRRRITIVS